MALLQWLLQASLPEGLLIFVGVLVIILATQRILEDLKAPPGPWGLPILGYFPFLNNENLSNQFKKLSAKYGNVFSIRVGQRLVIILSDYSSVKDTFVRKSDIFTGRRKGFLVDKFILGDQAILNTDGEKWKQQRRFVLSTLRDFGFAKLSLEGIVHEEVEAVRNFLTDSNGRPQFIYEIFSKAASNILNHLTFGVRYDFENQKLETLLKLAEQFTRNFRLFYYTELLPFLRLLPFSWMGYNEVLEFKENFKKFVRERIAEHEETFDPNNIRDLVDMYLLNIYKNEKIPMESKENSIFTRSDMEQNASLLFLAGGDSISSTLLWSLKLMLLYPKIQKKVQEELDSVVGRARLPSMNDKPNLPYTEATLLEVLRFSSFVPVNTVHTNTEEIELNGYIIPKGTCFLANFRQIHFDPKLWKNPEDFNPLRFLNKHGKVVKPEYLIPFSTGGRICLGESLARMELFIFFASLLQNFNLLPPDEQKVQISPSKSFINKLDKFQIRTLVRE